MKLWIVLGLAAFVVLATGYSGVLSIEKAFNASTIQIESSKITDATPVNESEHVECTLNESEEAPIVFDDDGKIHLGGLSFITSLESGLEEARSKDRAIFVYLHSKSCGWCKKFEEEVLTDPSVISIVEASFVPVAIEVNEQKGVARKFKVYGTPTMVFLDPGGGEIDRIRGFVDAEAFVAAMNGLDL